MIFLTASPKAPQSVPFRMNLKRTCVFLFAGAATTEIYTLSLHDALPIWFSRRAHITAPHGHRGAGGRARERGDRKSTRLNSSHRCTSYAVFCLKKKKHRAGDSG